MAALLEIKEHLKSFYSKFEAYIVPVLKFITALTALLLVNRELGFMSQLDSFAIVLVAALFCSFLPFNFIIVVSAMFTLGHVYKLSLECAVGVLVLFMVMFLLYFRFSPKDTIVVILTPICFVLKVPAVMPLAMGLVGGPASVISVGCGVIVYYVIDFISKNATMINSLDADGTLARFRYLADGIMGNKAMLMAVIAFAITIILVYIIRRLPVDHCWTYAMIAGALTNVVILMLGDLKFRTNISIIGTMIGSIVAIGIVKVLQFFVFNVDYSRTEHIQYEDDEYYYYVKAVPKMSVAISEKTVTRIDTKKPVYDQYSVQGNKNSASGTRSRAASGSTGSGSVSRSSTTFGSTAANRSGFSSAGGVSRSGVSSASSASGRTSAHSSQTRSGSIAANRAASGIRQNVNSEVSRTQQEHREK